LRKEYENWKTWPEQVKPKAEKEKLDHFERFFGYISRIKGEEILYFRMLLRPDLIESYVNWLINVRAGGRVPRIAIRFLEIAHSVAKSYDDKWAISQIKSLQSGLDELKPVVRKKQSQTTVVELLRAGIMEFPRYEPAKFGGKAQAFRACRSIAILLMTLLQLNSKQLREARLFHNRKRVNSKWNLLIKAGGKIFIINSERPRVKDEGFVFELPEPIATRLNEYLTVWRPLLESADSPDYLLLTAKGIYFTSADVFGRWIERGIFGQLGVRVSPRQVKESATEELLRDIGDEEVANLVTKRRTEAKRGTASKRGKNHPTQQIEEWMKRKVYLSLTALEKNSR
jgi:hypothetical protein